MFSQCESILCRNIFPHQDTPSIKITYSADVRVAEPFIVKMSANQTGSEKLDGGLIKYSFSNPVPMPSYLIGIVAGNLVETDLGSRVSIVTEHSWVEKVSSEVKDLSKYLSAVEDWIKYPYAWGKFTLVVLPPNFPYGGMEHPMLTYASPTVFMGDGSQIKTVIHEIVHHWLGNLLTCRTWSDFWLNEGFTVYVERKVSQSLGIGQYKIQGMIGNHTLYDEFEKFG